MSINDARVEVRLILDKLCRTMFDIIAALPANDPKTTAAPHSQTITYATEIVAVTGPGRDYGAVPDGACRVVFQFSEENLKRGADTSLTLDLPAACGKEFYVGRRVWLDVRL